MSYNQIDEDLADLLSNTFSELNKLKIVNLYGIKLKHPILFRREVRSGNFKLRI